ILLVVVKMLRSLAAEQQRDCVKPDLENHIPSRLFRSFSCGFLHVSCCHISPKPVPHPVLSQDKLWTYPVSPGRIKTDSFHDMKAQKEPRRRFMDGPDDKFPMRVNRANSPRRKPPDRRTRLAAVEWHFIALERSRPRTPPPGHFPCQVVYGLLDAVKRANWVSHGRCH